MKNKIKKKCIHFVMAAVCLALPLTASAHDKCDSLGIATTAAGIFWAPSAAFQVGYFAAKFIDESTSSTQNPNKKIKGQCSVGEMTREQYASIVSPDDEDPNQELKYLWDGAGALIQKSLALSRSVHEWQEARENVRDALIHGDELLAQQYKENMDQAHGEGMQAFTDYKNEHFTLAEIAAAASFQLTDTTRVPPLTVADVVESAEMILDNGPPPFESRYFSEVACLLPETITPAGVLAPDERFVNDPVPPGTFLNERILSSPAALYEEISTTFMTDVVEGLDKILPPGFVDNEPLPLEMSVITSGVIGENKLDIAPGTSHQTAFMLDLELTPVNPGIFIDPWWWHWIVGRPWDWLLGFRIEIVLDVPWPGPGPDPGPLDRLRIIAPFDDPETDMVMGELGTEFIQDLYFPLGTLNRERLPNADQLAKSMGGFFQIMDPSGAELLKGTIDKVDPEPVHMPVTTSGIIGENELGIEPGTAHQVSFMVDLKLEPEITGIFIDPWQWHWIVGTPWDWLFGFQIEIVLDVPRPPDPGPWDVMRIVAVFDDANDMVMDLERGSQFVQELYFPQGVLSKERLPDPTQWSQSDGGNFLIMDPNGKELLKGTIDGIAPGVGADSDGDNVDDFTDNCTTEANENQLDTDNDGFGNACDPDFNNNGVVDVLDFSRLKAVFGSQEAPDEDLNGNGVVDVLDFSKLKAFFGQAPGPSAIGMH